jgi:hypothetical protein
MKFAVIDLRNGKIIDLFVERKQAKTLADDWRALHHCVRPRVQETELNLRPGDLFPKS